MPYDDYYGDDYDDSGADYCRRCGGECNGDHDPDVGCNDEDEDLIDGVGFADPGGESALRAATKNNPRIHPCPSCHAPNVLTPKDVARGYQCDACANACENGWDRDLVCGGAEKGCEICKENEE